MCDDVARCAIHFFIHLQVVCVCLLSISRAGAPDAKKNRDPMRDDEWMRGKNFSMRKNGNIAHTRARATFKYS